MIDKIQRHLELMAPELQSYLNRKIFTRSEIDQIKDQRTLFENRCERTEKRLDDFLNYIKSEQKLEKTRNHRIKQMKIGLDHSDILLTKNVVSIYFRALHYFYNMELIESFSSYCIKRNQQKEMKDIFSKLCLKNISNYKLWLYCAEKLFEINDTEGFRHIVLSSLDFNIKNKMEIYRKFFELECKYVIKMNQIGREFQIDEEDKDEVERGGIPVAIFKEMLSMADKDDKNIHESLEISKEIPDLHDKLQILLNWHKY